MSYHFKNLSAADFEDLVRDLIGKELGVRFEGFCAGPDGGIDGRHAVGKGSLILQAKHYEGSSGRKLAAAMKRERVSIDQLATRRYLLATSCKLTPGLKLELTKLIGPSLRSQADIFGPEDLNGLLRKYPEVLKAHIKLWLSGIGVLERVLNAAAHTYATMTKDDIEHKVRVYAPNPSFDQSQEKLEKHHVLIISGPPGVGKTTLAEMLSYAYLSEDWDLVPIRSLEDGFAAIQDSKKQIFMFDDFLGRVALDKQALAHKDSELARFMIRIRKSKNARFILTTRGYIFEEARRVSEHLGDERLDVTKYVLDVGIYTRRIKARILYNHLLVSATPKSHIRALIDNNCLPAIIDHRNYNPRVIEAMTDTLRIGDIESASYPVAFLDALNNPSQIWDAAFRTHIDSRCRDLLIAMFFLSEYRVEIGELRIAYDSLHSRMSSVYGQPYGPKDFEEALRILEGSFVNIIGENVSFLNPSLRDYLSTYLSDADLVLHIAPTARTIDWVKSLWAFAVENLSDPESLQRIARACAVLLDMFENQPIWKPSHRDPRFLHYGDAANTARIELLISWWRITGDIRFADCAMRIARKPVQGFSMWRDADWLLGVFAHLRNEDQEQKFIYETEFLEVAEKALIDLIRWSAGSDDLASLVDSIEESGNDLPVGITSALQAAVSAEFSEIHSRVASEESESSLSEMIGALKKIAPKYNIPDAVLQRAILTVEERMAEIEEHSAPPSSPQFRPATRISDLFDDRALKDLFLPLLDR